MGKLDPDDPRPPYRQIADDLRDAIQSGSLAPGVQLPALSALSDEYGVSTGTVKSALAVVREAGLIVTRQGKGSYVRTRMSEPTDDHGDGELAELRRAVDALSERLKAVEERIGSS